MRVGEARRTEGEWKVGKGRTEGEELGMGKGRRGESEGRRGEGICTTNVKLLPIRACERLHSKIYYYYYYYYYHRLFVCIRTCLNGHIRHEQP